MRAKNGQQYTCSIVAVYYTVASGPLTLTQTPEPDSVAPQVSTAEYCVERDTLRFRPPGTAALYYG
jgi:hypothetical protein